MPPKLRVVAHSARYDKALETEISGQLASILKTNPKIKPLQAMWTVQGQILSNNPWEPLKNGQCAINNLPNEILGYIFSIGVKEEEEEEEEEGEWDSESEDEEEGDEWEDMDTDEDEESDGNSEDEVKVCVNVADSDNEDTDMDSDNDDGGDDEPCIPFQVLVSHVCKRWREVALDSHILWTSINFVKRPRLEKAHVYLARSGGLPLNIHIDCTFPEHVDEEDHPDHPLYLENKALRKQALLDAPEHDENCVCEEDGMNDDGDDDDDAVLFLSQKELEQILDLIEPEVSHWGTLDFHASTYGYVHLLLSRLHKLPAAPLLESFQLYHIEDCEDYETFHGDDNTSFLPFHGNAPLLKEAVFWGVHIDWDSALPSFLCGLRNFELSFHAKDVRPSYKTFSHIINNSPDLHSLSLSLSGPALGNDVSYDTDIEEGGWGATPLTIPSLKELALEFHELKYASALVSHLDVPNITSLLLNFDEEDYSDFISSLLKPVKGRTENMLMHIKHLKISGLPCNVRSGEALLGQLGKLESLNIKVFGLEEGIIFQKLADPYAGRPPVKSPATDVDPAASQQQPPVPLIAAAPYTTADLLPPTPTTSTSSSTPTLSSPLFDAPLPAFFCPKLETIVTSGVSGAEIKQLIIARRKLGVPLKKVSMDQTDHLSKKDEQWITENVQEFDFFEPSDSEEEEEEEGALVISGQDGDDEDENENDDVDDEDDGEDGDDDDENQTPQTPMFSPLARHLGRGRRVRQHRAMDLD